MHPMCASNPQPKWPLVLASGSPRRRELLALLGLPFVVRPADVQEENHVDESAAAMVVRLSQDKARAVLAKETGLILAADTSVCLEGAVLGKPADPADAVRMLRALRGRSHTVFSGVTLLDARSGWMCTRHTQTTVWMRDYGDAAISAYVATGDPLDKAGSYAIQYGDFAPVGRIDGCYANVMGLPLCHVFCLLRAAGQPPDHTPVDACDRFNRRKCDVALGILANTSC